MEYWHGAHTKHRLIYHLIWIPKYRKRILTGEVADRLKELFHECAAINRWKILELNVRVDHVHILVQIKPNIGLSKVVQMLKGGSSIIIRKEFPELREFLWGDSFWADGYFAETVGKLNYDKVREYIEN